MVQAYIRLILRATLYQEPAKDAGLNKHFIN